MKLFSKIKIHGAVFNELNRNKTKRNVNKNLKKIISDGFVEIIRMEFPTPEYTKLFKKDLKNY